MKRTHLVLLLLLPLTAQAEIFRCTNAKGTTTFSDLPCGNDATPYQVQVYQPSAEEQAAAKQAHEQTLQSLDVAQKERELHRLQEEMEQNDQQMRRELGQLRAKKDQAGAIGEQNIANEMQAVSQRYQNSNRLLQGQIDQLRQAQP